MTFKDKKQKDTATVPTQEPDAGTRREASRGAVETPEASSLLADLQRTRADFENFRKQVDSQREQAKEVAKSATVVKFLPLIDDIDRAIEAYPEQLGALKKTLTNTLTTLGLEKIDTGEGVEFNPDLHEAVLMEEGEGEREVISETLRAGYTYEGAVVRPAMVKVTHAN